MLKIIKPKEHALHHEKIVALLDLLTVHQHFDLPTGKQAKSHFVIAESDEKSVYGGAVLYPQKIPSVLDIKPTDTNEETVIKLTSFFQPEGKEYWAARICLCLERSTSAAVILETQNIFYGFYKELYQVFTEFGEKQGIEYLGYTLRVAETYNMNAFECWPRHLGVAPGGSQCDYIHGLLSLKGKGFKERQYSRAGRES